MMRVHYQRDSTTQGPEGEKRVRAVQREGSGAVIQLRTQWAHVETHVAVDLEAWMLWEWGRKTRQRGRKRIWGRGGRMGGWEEFEEGGVSDLGPESKAGVCRERH